MTQQNNDDLEVHKASPEMQIFFKKLLALKIYVEAVRDMSNNNPVFEKIFEKLDELIKQGK